MGYINIIIHALLLIWPHYFKITIGGATYDGLVINYFNGPQLYRLKLVNDYPTGLRTFAIRLLF